MSNHPSAPPNPETTPATMTHPSASLPPRPPPAQGPTRKTPAPIVPALPLVGAKKSFPALGRGHSSLPPKPVFPGKPLPRETDAIVLTPGEGNKPTSYISTPKSKRSFAPGGDGNNPRPMDPAVTNLTPQNSVSPSASHSGHHIPHTITPPADLVSGMKSLTIGQNPETNGHVSPRSPTGPRNRQSYNNINGTMEGLNEISGLGPRPNYVDFVHNHPINNLRPQQGSPVQHQDGFAHSQFGLPHTLHQSNFFYPQQFHPSGTLTPPNTGTIRMPNAGHLRSFSPSFPLSYQSDHPHGPLPSLHPFYPPPTGPVSQDVHQEKTGPSSQTAEDQAPESECTQVTFPNGERSWQTMETAAGRLESYSLSMFLEERLSDVTLVLINSDTGNEKRFSSHSFILGRSEQLYKLILGPSGFVISGQTADPGIISGSKDDGRIVLKLRSSVSEEAFILALRWMYGAPDWKIDAYLDFEHPSHTSEELARFTHASNEVMIDRAVQILKAGLLLGLDDLIYKAFNFIRNWGFSITTSGFERMIQFVIEEAPKIRDVYEDLVRHFWAIPENMMHEAIAYFSTTCPKNFKIDIGAPNSKFLARFAHPSSPSDFSRISTILFSIPFPILKGILESEFLFPNDQKKNRFDMASSVIQERERRRKREIKTLMDLVAKADEGESSSKTILSELKNEDSDLFWEESVVSTFGHGGIGIEVTKRKKGSPGGKVLWKVGKKAT
ncbi:hypothetical protein EX30DRAFT_220681 [Ascodesmis nigricans]|uniref:BTB domain-containing protein n=1 Tax=Ascodesmis nigricans TaxID=341454 RepID=A0A4S2MZV7_9PEZI|nr:hypothetical protein EX30DRAFT_220681 [Ascodesmis nigricans]